MSGLSRLEKVGTIFARMNSMLKKNVVPVSEKPIWYEIYAMHPPCTEPRYDQAGSDAQVREILYEEDLIRAKFHERVKSYEVINLSDHKAETGTKKFIDLYKNLKAQGALDDEQIFEVALEQLNPSRSQKYDVEDELDEFPEDDELPDVKPLPTDFGLVKSFTEAKNDKAEGDAPKKKKPASIDIKTLF